MTVLTEYVKWLYGLWYEGTSGAEAVNSELDVIDDCANSRVRLSIDTKWNQSLGSGGPDDAPRNSTPTPFPPESFRGSSF